MYQILLQCDFRNKPTYFMYLVSDTIAGLPPEINLKCLILLLKALKLQLKLLNFQNQKTNFPKKSKVDRGISPPPPCLIHAGDKSPHPLLS
jgi:hypothetical protein